MPDDLYERAKELPGGDNMSQLVQSGLQRLLDDRRRPPSYAHEPEQGLDLVVAAQKRLLVEAREDYAIGYTAALEAATGMPLRVVNALVDDDFDLKKWLDPFVRGASHDLMERGEAVTDPDEIKRLLMNQPQPSGSGLASEANREDWWWWLWRTAEALGDMADPIGFDAYCFHPTKARQLGYVEGMRDLWQSLESPVLTPDEVRARYMERWSSSEAVQSFQKRVDKGQ
jgi:hypothetical protein